MWRINGQGTFEVRLSALSLLPAGKIFVGPDLVRHKGGVLMKELYFRGHQILRLAVLGQFVFLGAAAAAKPLPHEWLPGERCAPASDRPVIDGRLNDSCWQSAVRTDAFLTPLGQPTKLRTTALIAHDSRNLYLGINCEDPNPASLVKEHHRRDSEVYIDDCVEVFVDANLDFKTYYHFLVNAGNVQRDERGDLGGTPLYDVSWDARWESAVAIGERGWTVELAIPFDQLGIELSRDEAIGLNLCRHVASTRELSCWVPTQGGFHNPHRHATLILACQPTAPALRVEITSVGSLRPGEDLMVGTFKNLSPRTLELESEVRVGSNRDLWRSHQKWGALSAGEAVQNTFQYRVAGPGPHNLCLLVRESRTGALLYVGNLTFPVPLLLAQKFGARLPSPPWCSLWWAESTYKISPDHAVPETAAEAVQVAAAGNEYEAFQLILRPRREMKGVWLYLTPFRSSQGTIGQGNFKIFRAEYVKVETPSDALGSPGLYPDPLVPVTTSLDLPPDQNTVLWIQLRVPPGTRAGEYRGEVRVHPGGETPFPIPVRLRVFDFSLTAETHTRTAYGLGPDWSFLGVTDPQQREQVFEKYLQAFREHRLSPYNPFAFHPMKHELHGPQWRLKNGPLELIIDRFSNRYFTVLYRGEEVGSLTNTITQFEKEGVGWKGTGVGWPGINRLKQVKVLARTPERWVVEVTGERTSSGAASRRYEITFRFAIAAGQPAFAARMVRFKNTDDLRYEMRGYYYILRPEGQEAQKAKGPGYAAWLLPSGKTLGAIAVPPNVTFDLAPIYVRKSTWLEPGQEISGFGPTLVFFAGEATDAEGVQGMVAQLRAALEGSGLDALKPVSGAKIAAQVREEVSVTFDFADFDRAAKKYLDDWKFNGFNFRAMPASIAGYPRFTPEYNRLHAEIYGPMVAHLKEKGWLEKAYSYWFDEPSEDDYPYVIKGMDLLGQNCPGLTRLLTEQVEDPLVGHVDLWVPVLSRYNPERCQARQAAGDQVWWYVCCGPRAPYPNNFIDHPAVNHRIRFWMMEKYGVTGSLYWQTTYWRGEGGKLRNPWQSAASISPSGGFWGNGDGMLLYPACREPSQEPVLEGPVITLRLEMLRDGLEDREYFWTLKQLVRRAEAQLAKAEGRRRQRLQKLLREAQEALRAPDRLIRSLTEYSPDPQDLLRERTRIAEAIESLRQAGFREGSGSASAWGN